VIEFLRRILDHKVAAPQGGTEKGGKAMTAEKKW